MAIHLQKGIWISDAIIYLVFIELKGIPMLVNVLFPFDS